MVAVITLLIVVILSLLVVRIATVALILTGLSTEVAVFQARSAFSGTGYTTSESETMVTHPLRRRIVMLLMVLQNAGLVTIISSLMITFANVTDAKQGVYRLLTILIGVLTIWRVTHISFIDKQISKLIRFGLTKWTDLDVRDYWSLLRFQDDYFVSELVAEAEDWIVDQRLTDLDLTAEGVLVLGVHRVDGSFIGTPRGNCLIHADDTLILYGRKEALVDLDQRKKGWSGDKAHNAAIEEQKHIIETQDE